ncbi:uncharacterized protein B0I36DRAFT_297829 [Microdochium trichocladiopsis]|uniref:Sodium:neurotransmitter symporter family protein n=1 Tax=Microdochium trichocladiopsis TaxID=1682393 RepID=A0A9P8XUC7_9PEZI|nr:uncharacterized protein B0I36DRAFT_297829 [Microdochium trichocladiopsis]KAH7018263.1 hypothetical protein B0I36DRAFT_297829 [Microdochium trichocladiopsis]
MEAARKVGRWFAPPPDKAADGRDQWPSRTAFVLASMGGCAGMGNLLRYPSQVYNNYGLQWFIPYLLAIFLIAIPVLTLEIAIGNAYRGGSVVASNTMHHRLKGAGLAILFIGFVVGPYFVVNLAWIMTYFRYSFTSPLPWAGRGTEFFEDVVVANPDPVPGMLSDDMSQVIAYTSYPGMGVIPETAAWCLFTWFLVWLCIFRGVGLTGRVIYWTMGLPIVITVILIGRSCSLPNASAGVAAFWATWRGEELAKGQLWQTACSQVFFSCGIGFGYFSSYASYNRQHSNALADALMIATSNAVFENVAAFAVYGVIGFTGLWPWESESPIGGFTVGFLTLPLAIVEMPAANFWAVMLFFTLMVLGFSSAFAMLDAVVTLWMDSGTKLSRPVVVTTLVVVSFLLSLPYATEFGYYLLDGVDRWISNVALVFVVFTECVTSTTVYRWRDIEGQVGLPAFVTYNFGYFGGMLIGLITAHSVSAPAGAGAGFGVFLASLLVALFIAKTPDVKAPRFWQKNVFVRRFWLLAFYSGNQLTADLNVVVGSNGNWALPFWWAPLLRYISGPILAIVYSFSYPDFYSKRQDPTYIYGFALAHCALLIVALGFVVPRWFDSLIPPPRRNEGHIPYAPLVTLDPDELRERQRLEAGAADIITKASVDSEARRRCSAGDGKAESPDGLEAKPATTTRAEIGLGRRSSSEQDTNGVLTNEKQTEVK